MVHFGVEYMQVIFKHKILAPVVQRLDNAIHWISRYRVDKC